MPASASSRAREPTSVHNVPSAGLCQWKYCIITPFVAGISRHDIVRRQESDPLKPARPNGLALASALLVVVGRAAAAPAGPEEVPLWSSGAPGFEARRAEPTLARDYWVKNVHNPSLTVYLPPKEKATGAAVVICPGGGHRLLVFHAEGEQPGEFLQGLGVAAFVLKYRLGREEGSPYSVEKHAREDGLRAMRLVRSRAKEWNVDPARIGMMGFSAGGEVVSMVAFGAPPPDPQAADAVDRASSRPDFLIYVYPGPLGVPDTVPADAPPAFLLVASDDELVGVTTSLLQRYESAKVPVEAHVLARGAHGFNMGDRSKLASVKTWPQRLADWLADSGYLQAGTGADRKP
jgi:acetyl esterase/lipase